TLLYEIDPRTYRTAFDAASADVDAARLLVDRYRPLLDIKAVSQQEFDTAVARLKQAEAALARARLDLENTRVPAPISGRIGRSLVTEGALVGRGEATPLATIEQIDPLYANFTQSGAELAALREAVNSGRWKAADRAQVELVLENGSVYPLPGKLLFSDLAVDPATGAVSLRAQFPNPQRELLPGMFVRIRFPQATAEQVVRVPQRAVQMAVSGPNVLVVDAEGKVGVRPIRTGGMSGNAWIVTDGLKEGEQVIVEGHMKARPGATVKPVPWSPPASPAPTAGAPQQPPQGK
ncbi:MAG: efflux RND transporter periplasmic adaptor subunit, partial [Azospira sp.]|nr:efflux RND transporter periplasmic adaptor subunit [Azospira sp.]